MAANAYHFITTWRVEGDIHEVAAILDDAPGLMRWWPAVYLNVEVLDAGGENDKENDTGKVVSLYTKGWLPYTLRWQFRVTEMRYPYGFTLHAWGDFDGRGVWTFEQNGLWVDVTYDWSILANKPLLRRLSFLLKPVFAANHRWAMATGEESLRLELARRHAATPQERARIPAPPPPTATPNMIVLLGIVAGIAAVGGISYQALKGLRSHSGRQSGRQP